MSLKHQRHTESPSRLAPGDQSAALIEQQMLGLVKETSPRAGIQRCPVVRTHQACCHGQHQIPSNPGRRPESQVRAILLGKQMPGQSVASLNNNLKKTGYLQ